MSQGKMQKIPVIGHFLSGERKNSFDWPADEHYEVDWVSCDSLKQYEQYSRFALEVRDDSMNLVYPEGSLVVCVAFEDLGDSPLVGDRLLVHRKGNMGWLEATVREFREDEKGQFWLWPRSTSPDHQQPEEIDPEEHSTPRVGAWIVGLVVASWQPSPLRPPTSMGL